MGPNSPLSPLHKEFSSQWLIDECGFDDTDVRLSVESSLRQKSDSAAAVQNDVSHGALPVAATTPFSQTEEEETGAACETRGERHCSLLHNKNCFTRANQALKTPCFSDSGLTPLAQLVDSPMCLSAAKCISPMLFLSPLMRPSGVDLSMYLPENYVAAANEALESSFDRDMFQFPAVNIRESPSVAEMDVDLEEGDDQRTNCERLGKIPRFAANVVGRSVWDETAPRLLSEAPNMETKLSGNSLGQTEIEFSRLSYFEDTSKLSEAPNMETKLPGNSLGQTEIEFSRLYFESASRWASVSSTENANVDYADISDEDIVDVTAVKSHAREEEIYLEEFPKGKVIKATDRYKEMSASVRNKLERDRRRKLNTKLEKLRQSVPQVAQNKRASKATILHKAVEYVNQLRVEEASLFGQKAAEKSRNEELVRKLVQLTSNII